MHCRNPVKLLSSSVDSHGSVPNRLAIANLAGEIGTTDLYDLAEFILLRRLTVTFLLPHFHLTAQAACLCLLREASSNLAVAYVCSKRLTVLNCCLCLLREASNNLTVAYVCSKRLAVT